MLRIYLPTFARDERPIKTMIKIGKSHDNFIICNMYFLTSLVEERTFGYLCALPGLIQFLYVFKIGVFFDKDN